MIKYRIPSLHSIVVLSMVLFTGLLHAEMLSNGDFAAHVDNQPTGWRLLANEQKVSIDTNETTGKSKQSLRVDIDKDVGNKSLGQIIQKVTVLPNNRYVVKADIKSSKKGIALLQIKLQNGREELYRLSSEKSTTEWKTVSKTFDTSSADTVLVLLRYKQGESQENEEVWFANVTMDKE